MPGQANLLAVCVLNTSRMGGIWRPVYVVAGDAELTLQEVQEAVKQAPKTRTKNIIAMYKSARTYGAYIGKEIQ